MEVWAGIECTVNRVRDGYVDQVELTGHAGRGDDLDRFASLGVAALRYPILWERTAPDGLARADWSWADERLGRLRELAIRPIVGLVHHGSGPRSTSLLDPGFPDRLAEYAHAVAERFPWVEDWTPVNEPLTTARFSALYGHWYPHVRDGAALVRALVVQCRAIVLATEAVRAVNPQARLVVTEDLGKTYSTPALAYQAEYENERRFASFDLLTGMIDEESVFWRWALADAGFDAGELAWFRERRAQPDVLGVNHYLTSERWLDERLDRYPPASHGGNGRERYADVEALRVPGEGYADAAARLLEVWRRYGLPVAITEAHNGSTREEQLRWLDDAWRGALAARTEGADVRAVTVWALLGAVGWDRLVTRRGGKYEPGAFDVRSREPRPTALASMARGLARDGAYEHPVLDGVGWWKRPDRVLYGDQPPATRPIRPVRPLLVVGVNGTLGRAFARACAARGLEHRLVGRADLDIADERSAAAALDTVRPWAVVNAAGYVRVDDAEGDAARCMRENAEGPAVLARACAERAVRLLTFSSDLVFDGAKTSPYVEGDGVAPLSVYGRSKAVAERSVSAVFPDALVVRTSAFFGPWDTFNFVTVALRELAARRPFAAAADLVVSPTYVPDLVDASLDLLVDGERGIWHLANDGRTTWADLARSAAALAGVSTRALRPRPADALGLAARRPRFSALASARATLMAPLDDALARYSTAVAAA